jgi:flagellar motor protein MotB
MTVSPDGAMTSNTTPLTANNMQMTQSGNKLGDEPSKHNDEKREGNHQLNFSGMTEEELALEAKKNGVNILDEMEKAKEEELQKLREEVEEAQNLTFESIKETIYSEIRQSPELAELEKQLLIDVTPEGLRIQIVDEDGR